MPGRGYPGRKAAPKGRQAGTTKEFDQPTSEKNMSASVTIEDNEAEFEASEADERATLALCDLLE